MTGRDRQGHQDEYLWLWVCREIAHDDAYDDDGDVHGHDHDDDAILLYEYDYDYDVEVD